MGYILIAIGIILAVIGTVMIVNQGKHQEIPAAEPQEQQQQQQQQQQTPKEKGNDFEAYVADILKGSGVKIKQWNQGTVTASGAMGENALNPDFFVEQPFNNSHIEYWLECKWRKDINNGFSFPQSQIDRYKTTQRDSKRKILIIFGIGGQPSAPASVYIIPLDSISGNTVSKEDLRPYYYSDPAKQFTPRITKYFRDYVFKK